MKAAAGACACLSLVLINGVVMADQNDPELGPLFEQLERASNPADAAAVEREIWARWLRSGNDDVDAQMSRGMEAMERGDGRAALLAFDEVVEHAPGFAEGWNKRATLYWLMGNHAASVEDIERTLALEPRHFGALSGLAMVRDSQGRPFDALEALEKLMAIHPQLPMLQQRIDNLTAQLGESI